VASLADCLRLAMQRQPLLAAQRASLAAAEDGARAVENLKVPRVLEPDLPIRRQQASLGVTAAAAGVSQAEQETVYAVTRTYVSVLYARAQQSVAKTVVERLTALSKAAKQQLDAGAPDVTQNDIDRTAFYLDLAEARRIQAEEGAERALAALKEAIGLEPCTSLDVPSAPLPEPQARPCREEVVAWAVSRRGAVVQSDTFASVAALEVEAQGMHARLRVETFASAADIHAHQVPQGSRGTEYSPGTEPPEMPDTLVGCREERVQHARDLSDRAAALAEKTRGLVALEAQDAFYRWQEANRKRARLSKAIETGERLADNLRKDFTSQQKVRTEEVLNAQVQASVARSEYNQALHEEIVALADLERITAGGFCAGLAETATTAQNSPVARPSGARAGE
jgi:outer membrane protein TolC